MTPDQFNRAKYQLQLLAENAKVNGKTELKVNAKHLAEMLREYGGHFTIDHQGAAWFNGVKLVKA